MTLEWTGGFGNVRRAGEIAVEVFVCRVEYRLLTFFRTDIAGQIFLNSLKVLNQRQIVVVLSGDAALEK